MLIHINSMFFLVPRQSIVCLVQHDTQWRKAQTKLEGEEEFEALDKYSRLDVFEEYVRCAIGLNALMTMLLCS